MIPYEVIAEIARDSGMTFRQVWMAFCNWESLRFFHDDPSSTSKDAIQWLNDLSGLCLAIENDFDGPGKARCLEALESAFAAFSRLDLPDEFCDAIRKWRAERLREELIPEETTKIGQDLDWK